ncbi:MAG: hypothetical protein GYA17_02455 [Chloroflexi bacterium]|nr:hypothetical protein [Chloroflexota bacterium]
MTTPVRLIPMLCIRCQNPLPAQPGETAWVCSNCGQGQLLSDEQGLEALEVHFAAGLPAGKPGRPFWVAEGTVRLQRETYRGDQSGAMQAFWGAPRRFFVPAYELPLPELVETGLRLLQQPPALQAGSPAAFLPVSVPPTDVRPLAEFILLAVEAARKDDLRELRFDLSLSAAELWVLP